MPITPAEILPAVLTALHRVAEDGTASERNAAQKALQLLPASAADLKLGEVQQAKSALRFCFVVQAWEALDELADAIANG